MDPKVHQIFWWRPHKSYNYGRISRLVAVVIEFPFRYVIVTLTKPKRGSLTKLFVIIFVNDGITTAGAASVGFLHIAPQARGL